MADEVREIDPVDTGSASDDSYLDDMMAKQVAELRMQCLRLAVENTVTADDAVAAAKQFYDFVSCADEGDDG